MFFWNSLAFFYDPVDVDNLISGSFAFSKSSLYIWKFTVHILLKVVCKCERPSRHGFVLWVRKIPYRRAWESTPVFLPGESCGQRSLASYSPCDNKKSDTTEWLTLLLLAFSMIQQILEIWSLPFLNPACTSGSSQFTCCWTLAWRIWGFTLLVCEMSAIVQ